MDHALIIVINVQDLLDLNVKVLFNLINLIVCSKGCYNTGVDDKICQCNFILYMIISMLSIMLFM